METQVFLLTDIEGSSRRWVDVRAEMRDALERHDGLLTSAIQDRGGAVFKHTGDGLFAVLPSVGEAVHAAVAGQHAIDGEDWGAIGGLRVRMVIHAGDASPRAGDWFGPGLNRTARLAGFADGGQILMSDAAHGLLADTPLADVTFVDLGVARLKGLDAPERVWQVSAKGLRSDFENRVSETNDQGNLPASLSRFVGRVHEVNDLLSVVRDHRLTTIVGAGGMGKTRLSIAGARAVSDLDAAVRPSFVALAPVTSAEGVDAAVLAALGETAMPGQPVRRSVVKALRRGPALMVLDNCEHILGATGAFALELLSSCPELRVLTTSRQALNVQGERLYALTPMIPSDQVELFVDRSTAVRGSVHLDRDQVARICARLDGMPLAIELAASRTRAMSLREIEDHLDSRFRLLGGDGRRSPPVAERHRTLGAVVDWSFDLLTTEEQQYLCALSVLVGAFDAHAAQAVTRTDDLLGTLDMLERLVDRSLVVVDELDDRSTYRLLETMREYGRERLSSTELLAIRSRHAEHYAAVLADAVRALRGGDDETPQRTLQRDWANLRVAVRHALDIGDAELALRLTASLSPYAYVRPDAELASWTTAALALDDATEHPLALNAHLMLSQVAYTNMELADAERHAVDALATVQRLGLRPFPRPYLAVGYALMFQGRLSEAVEAIRRAADIARGQGRMMDLAEALHNHMFAFIAMGRRPEPTMLDELAAVALDLGTPRARAIQLCAEAQASFYDHRDGTDAKAARAVESVVAAGLLQLEGQNRTVLGIAHALAVGSVEAAISSLHDVIACYERLKLPLALGLGLREYSWYFGQVGRFETVAVLQGAGLAVSYHPAQVADIAERARHHLGGDRFDLLLERGGRMGMDDVAGYLRAELAEVEL